MWDNPRTLNLAAGVLVGLAVLVFTLAGVQLLLRSELFPLRALQVSSPLKHTTKSEIAAAVNGRFGGNFFALELTEVRAALEQIPWVRSVAVRRIWPDT